VAGRVGAAVGPRGRRVVIKSRFVRLGTVSAGSCSAHVRYIVREGVSRDGARGLAYSASEDNVNLVAFEERSRGDRHQFRFIVSVEDAQHLDELQSFTRELMDRVSVDLETRLDWIAVDHWDTGSPHTHVVMRGRAADNRDLVIAPDYMAHGMRRRAVEIATEWLGPRTELEVQRAVRQEVDQQRFTSLDRWLLRHVSATQIDLIASGANSGEQGLALRSRLDRLESWGLARQTVRGSWELAPALEPTLVQMGERGDIIKTMHRALGDRAREHVIRELRDPSTIVGRVADKGFADELNDRGYLVVDGIDGRGHYVPLPATADIGELPVGGIVAIGSPSGGRSADRTIARIGRDGIYRTTDHITELVRQGRAVTHAEDIVRGHVRRLEALRRVGSVERIGDGVWRIPYDLPRQGETYDARQARHSCVEVLSQVPIDRQVRAMGATWLDRQLVTGEQGIASVGFGQETRDALRERESFLVEKGWAERVGARIVVRRNLLAYLQNLELDAIGAKLAAETKLAYRATSHEDSVTGTYRRSVLLASGRFAMLDDGLGFSLVPWHPVIEPRLGQSMTAIIRSGAVSWQFGRQRGPSIG
jgi:type IV secretory pathway VirD2 relaxase